MQTEIKLHFSDGQRDNGKAAEGQGTAAFLRERDDTARVVVLRCRTARLQNPAEDMNEPGEQLRLVREPDNQYDRWATRVCTLSGTMLGYLPARQNQSVARLIDAGKKITAFVDRKERGELLLVLYMDVKLPKVGGTENG